jgi:glycosyltransferase involved in cell wall biosynthesis
MRVAFLAAGAANMYCGSCIRDNRVVATLRARGRDVLLIPLYTPLRLDEPDVSTGRVFYGGVNVYLQQKSALFRYTPWLLDRMFDSPGLIRRLSRRASAVRAEDLGELTVSMLRGEHGQQRKELNKLIVGLRKLKPDLINLPDLMFVGIAGALKRALNVPIVCTLSGEDLFTSQLPEPHRSDSYRLIREGAQHIDRFLSITRYYARFASEHFGIPSKRVSVSPLGVPVDDQPPADPPPPLTIGYLARICPEKGLANLADAFIALRREGRRCRLRIAGYLGPADQPYFDAVWDRLRSAGALDAVEHVGEVEFAEKQAFLRGVHVLSVPTVYHEAKGLYVLEALAAGTPVVQPNHGSFPELIEQTGGGILYDPDAPGALAAGLARVMDDTALRRGCGRRGYNAVRASFTSEHMADSTWSLYERVLSPHPSPLPEDGERE